MKRILLTISIAALSACTVAERADLVDNFGNRVIVRDSAGNTLENGVSTTGEECQSEGVSVTGTCGELIDYTQSDARQCWLQGGEFNQSARLCVPVEQQPFVDEDRNGIEDNSSVSLEDYIQRWYRGGRSIYDNIDYFFPGDYEEAETTYVEIAPTITSPPTVEVVEESPAAVEPPVTAPVEPVAEVEPPVIDEPVVIDPVVIIEAPAATGQYAITQTDDGGFVFDVEITIPVVPVAAGYTLFYQGAQVYDVVAEDGVTSYQYTTTHESDTLEPTYTLEAWDSEGNVSELVTITLVDATE